MSDKLTYKEKLTKYFENNKIFVWLSFMFLGIIFLGKVVSSLDYLGVNNEKKEKRCKQLDENVNELFNQVSDAIHKNDYIDLLEIQLTFKESKILIEKANELSCFDPEWNLEKLNMLKRKLLIGINSIIHNSEIKLKTKDEERRLKLLCENILSYFSTFDQSVLSPTEKEVLLNTIKILQDEN